MEDKLDIMENLVRVTPMPVKSGEMVLLEKYTFFLKFLLENEIFPEYQKFSSQFSQICIAFSQKMQSQFFISEVDSESLSTHWKIIFKREAS